MSKKVTMYECERTGKAFRTEAEARKSENEFPKHKIEKDLMKEFGNKVAYPDPDLG